MASIEQETPGVYRNRADAGRLLAEWLHRAPVGRRPLVLALPRGGVPVAAEVARTLRLPLDVFLVRKLGLPRHPELAMGAVASGGIRVLNEEVIALAHVSAEDLERVTLAETDELARRLALYRPGRPPVDPRDQAVIIVDDGLATGSSMRAALRALRAAGAARITVAVPVGARSTCEALAREVDLLVCPLQPEEFVAVGAWYDDFSQVSDEEVRLGLERGNPAAVAGRG